MTLEECYNRLEGNYSEAKTRLMNDTLVDRFIRRFPSDPSMQQLRQQVAAGNRVEAFHAVHTLKGVAANLSFTRLQRDASELTEQLRSGDSDASAELVQKVEESYTLVMDTLNEYMNK